MKEDTQIFPTKEDAQILPMKEEVGKIDEGSRQPRVSKHEAEEDGNYYLSRETFFDLTMSKSHLSPHFLVNVPLSITKLLPGKTLPVVLRRGGKDWNMSYLGERKRPTFDFKWRTFAEGNNLKLGDACIFELMENGTNLLFKVHILRHELPPELVQRISAYGKTAETPICIDDD